MESLIQELLEPDHSLEEEVSRNWGEILIQHYQFDRLEKEVELKKKNSNRGCVRWLVGPCIIKTELIVPLHMML